MTTKEQLKNNIKEWMQYEKDLRILQKKSREIRQAKKELTDKIVKVMKDKEIDCFDLNDGKICYTKKNVKKPINNKLLLEILTKYYSGDITQASEINNFINDNRTEITKENITRKISKTNNSN